MHEAVAPGLVATGVLVKYNGFDLTGVDLQTSLQTSVIYDDAGRTQSAVKMDWTFVTIVNIDDIEDALNRLNSPGGRLEISGLGFRDLDINNPNGSGVRDVAWGPLPQVMGCEIFQIGYSWKLTWTVSTQIPFCTDGTPSYMRKLQTLTYDVSFDINELGRCTRTINGELTIPMTRPTQGTRVPPDNPEDYYELVNPVVPLGFKRVNKPRSLSKDRRTLTFGFTDTEINSDNPYPQGIVNIEMTEDIGSESIALIDWNYSISGTIEVAAPYPKSWAWDKFILVAYQRLKWQRSHSKPGKGVVYITSIRISDEIFGRRSTFQMSWRLVCPVEDILKVSGIWVPIEGADWGRWRTSMEAGPWRTRGESNLQYRRNDDLIIDLCQNSTLPEQDASNVKNRAASAAKNLNTGKPSAESSWMEYECWIELEEESGEIRHVPLPMSPPKKLTREQQQFAKKTKAYSARKAKQDTSLQTRAETSFRIVLVGYAIRVGFPITPPELTEYGGQEARRSGKAEFATGIYSGGNPAVYWARWRTPYLVKNAPQDPSGPKGPK